MQPSQRLAPAALEVAQVLKVQLPLRLADEVRGKPRRIQVGIEQFADPLT